MSRKSRKIQKLARGQGRRAAPRSGTKKKLAVVRLAVRHRFPTADIGEMLAQIESGYGEMPR